MSTNKIIEILGDQSDFLLNHTCKTIDKSLLHIPSPNTIDEIWMSSDRNTRTLNSLQSILSHGRLANTGPDKATISLAAVGKRVFPRNIPWGREVR